MGGSTDPKTRAAAGLNPVSGMDTTLEEAAELKAGTAVTATVEALSALIESGNPLFKDGKMWTPHRPARPPKSEGGIEIRMVSDYEPAGDQPTAIKDLVEGLENGDRSQVLLGVTGSGKTFTMAKVIEATQRPAVILAPNKTLAAQLYGEFKNFFPDNAVEYFVSYYDYYQPEAYVPRSDTFIEKESINEQIDRMRHSATRSLLERDDCIIVASVSCIYGIGSVETYTAMTFQMNGRRGSTSASCSPISSPSNTSAATSISSAAVSASAAIHRTLPGPLGGCRLAHLHVRRRDRVDHRVRPADRPEDRRPEFGQDLRQFALCHPAPDAERRPSSRSRKSCACASPSSKRPAACWRPSGWSSAPATTSKCSRPPAPAPASRTIRAISPAAPRRAAADAVRIHPRQRPGVHRRKPRHRAADRRHVSRRLPAQGDAGRIRLPPALLHGQPAAALRGMGRDAPATVAVSATPGGWEMEAVRRRLRRTGHPPDRPDRPAGRGPPGPQPGRRRARRDPRDRRQGLPHAVTVLTKRMAEDLTEYLHEQGVRVRYMHSDIDTLERIEIIRDLRLGAFDVLVGINLLREGLDIPECGFVAILDADKEGLPALRDLADPDHRPRRA
jgi:flavodoxin